MTTTTHPTPHRLQVAFGLFLIIVLAACSPGLQLSDLFGRPTAEVNAKPAIEIAEVTFLVSASPALQPGDQVTMEILDEVTGLAINPMRQALTAQDDGSFSVKLPFTIGSIVKYRYIRTGENKAVELNGNRQPVRYRMFYVSGPSLVARDLILAWNDAPFQGETGRLRGQVINQTTNQPVPNAMVSIGGATAFTASDGSFLVDNLPPGEMNLVVMSLTGEYLPFQQGAVIVGGAMTPATISLLPSPLVNITFLMSAPAGSTTGLPVRLVGSLPSLGNTFADLGGGLSTLSARAPLMTLLPDGRYSLILQLPAGTDLRYKYSQGDGFWNAEQTNQGHFNIRQLIVPNQDTIIEDQVSAWTAGDYAPVTFTVKVPEQTPTGETVSIQFNPYGWTEPVPMWPIGNQEWVFILNSPMHLLGNISYRYCRNDQCDRGGAAAVQATNHADFSFIGGKEGQSFQDVIESWTDWQPVKLDAVNVPDIIARDDNFVTGIELETHYSPDWQPYLFSAIGNIADLSANWVILTPEWTATQPSPAVIEMIPGHTPLFTDLGLTVSEAKQHNLKVAVYPHIIIAGDPAAYWSHVAEDGWWNQWFERYSRFLLNYADFAQQAGAQAIILGEPQIEPAMSLTDNSTSSWATLVRDIHARFSGEIWWAVSYQGELGLPASWLNTGDRIYLEWDSPVAQSDQATLDEMSIEFSRQLEEQVAPFQSELDLPLVVALRLPSANGAITGCVQAGEGCLEPDQVVGDIEGVQIDLMEQADAYNALLHAVNQASWVDGFVSQGYYPPISLQDSSSSIHGKPAADVLWYWFPRLLGRTQ